jgi:hypothetical protein
MQCAIDVDREFHLLIKSARVPVNEQLRDFIISRIFITDEFKNVEQ